MWEDGIDQETGRVNHIPDFQAMTETEVFILASHPRESPDLTREL
jgi:hypothetical protein